MKKIYTSLLLVSLLGMPAVSFGELGTIEPVPAATLLIPYFAVDLDACVTPGLTTFLSITNTVAESTVAHVTLWTDFRYRS